MGAIHFVTIGTIRSVAAAESQICHYCWLVWRGRLTPKYVAAKKSLSSWFSWPFTNQWNLLLSPAPESLVVPLGTCRCTSCRSHCHSVSLVLRSCFFFTFFGKGMENMGKAWRNKQQHQQFRLDALVPVNAIYIIEHNTSKTWSLTLTKRNELQPVGPSPYLLRWSESASRTNKDQLDMSNLTIQWAKGALQGPKNYIVSRCFRMFQDVSRCFRMFRIFCYPILGLAARPSAGLHPVPGADFSRRSSASRWAPAPTGSMWWSGSRCYWHPNPPGHGCLWMFFGCQVGGELEGNGPQCSIIFSNRMFCVIFCVMLRTPYSTVVDRKKNWVSHWERLVEANPLEARDAMLSSLLCLVNHFLASWSGTKRLRCVTSPWQKWTTSFIL